jgi:hypothetical protein
MLVDRGQDNDLQRDLAAGRCRTVLEDLVAAAPRIGHTVDCAGFKADLSGRRRLGGRR